MFAATCILKLQKSIEHQKLLKHVFENIGKIAKKLKRCRRNGHQGSKIDVKKIV